MGISEFWDWVALDWFGPCLLAPIPCPPSIEIDQKLQEIMKQTGYLTIGGQVPLLMAPGGGGVGGVGGQAPQRD